MAQLYSRRPGDHWAMNLILKIFDRIDLDRVVALDQLCFGQLWSVAQYEREHDSPNSDILILVDTDTQQILAYGCVWAIVDEAHITIIAVHPDQRHQGFGQLVLWGLLQRAVMRDLARATLEVRLSNAAAIGLYEKFGFQTAGQRKKYYENPTEDALILWKNRLQFPATQTELASQYQIITTQLLPPTVQLTVRLDAPIGSKN
jgi:[ribosomal protein S18]-alanine N-acetyltransferase